MDSVHHKLRLLDNYSRSSFPVVGEAALLEPGRVAPRVFTLTKPRTGRPTQGSWHAVWLRTVLWVWCRHSTLSAQCHVRRNVQGELSTTTHGLHHFLSDSVFSVVNGHLCAIRKASSHLFHVCVCVSAT